MKFQFQNHVSQHFDQAHKAFYLKWTYNAIILNINVHYTKSFTPIRRGFAPGFVNYKKGCTQLAAASYEVYQLLAHGQWFSSGTSASSTTKTGHHDIAESGV